MGQPQKPNSEDKKIVTLGRVVQILREEENVDVLIETTLNYLKTEFEYSLIWIGLYDHIEHRILGKGGITPTGDISYLKQRFFLQPGDLLEQVVIQQRPIGVPDLAEATRAGEWRKAALNFKIRGTLIFPIRHRDRCFGVVLLGQAGWGISPQAEEKAQLSMLLGTMAASLNQIEVNWNRQRTKRPDEPLLAILNKLRSLPSILQRLETIVLETHQFVGPTRTNIYWFEPEKRYFWRRMSNRLTGIAGDNQQSASGITVQEAGSFYNAMISEQIVIIGEAHSSLKADVTSRLLQRLAVRSLLAAPIILDDELLGFLAVEGNEPRIWKDEEKNYLRGAAQLIALISPIEEMEANIKQTKQDQLLLAEIAQAVYSEEDWQNSLKKCSEELNNRLQFERFLVLLFDRDRAQFEICYQSHPVNRKPLGSQGSKGAGEQGSRGETATHPFLLPTLSQVDWKLLERSSEAVGIEDLSGDLKLLSWRDGFLEALVRSLLLCNTSVGKPLSGLLIIANESPRIFSAAEREVFRVVSQQIGLILHQWELQRQSLKQEKVYQSLQWGLTMMQQAPSVAQMEEVAGQAIANMLGVPVTALVSWFPGDETAKIVSSAPLVGEFAINSEFPIPLHTDELIQEVLATDGIVYKNAEQLPASTRLWITGNRIGEVMAMALRTTPEHSPTGIVLVADGTGRHWPESVLPAFSLLVSQLAWFRRLVTLTTTLQSQRQELQCLNWHKHRAVEDFCRTLATAVKSLVSLVPKDTPQEVRYRQICSQLDNSLASISQMFAREFWSTEGALQPQPEDPIRVTSLLRRSLERVDDFIKSRRLWTKVHDAGEQRNGREQATKEAAQNARSTLQKNSLVLLSPSSWLVELIVYELLVAACQRAFEGGRIDIWYRQLNAADTTGIPYPQCLSSEFFLELSIADNGDIDPQLIADLQRNARDELAFSTLDRPPGLHLRICQLLVASFGGFLNLYRLEDGRILSLLQVPMSLAE